MTVTPSMASTSSNISVIAATTSGSSTPCSAWNTMVPERARRRPGRGSTAFEHVEAGGALGGGDLHLAGERRADDGVAERAHAEEDDDPGEQGGATVHEAPASDTSDHGGESVRTWTGSNRRYVGSPVIARDAPGIHTGVPTATSTTLCVACRAPSPTTLASPHDLDRLPCRAEVSGYLVDSAAFKAVGTSDPRPAGSIPVHLRHSVSGRSCVTTDAALTRGLCGGVHGRPGTFTDCKSQCKSQCHASRASLSGVQH